MHQVEPLVGLVELQLVGDQIVDVDLPLHVPVDDFGHIGAAPRAAKSGSLPDAAGDKLEGAGGNFLARAGDADDDADAPATVATFERLAHDADIADALEAVIGATLGEVHEIGDELALDFLRVDEMGHPELLGKRPPLRVEIDADYHAGTGHMAALDDVEPDPAETEDDNIGAGLDLGRGDSRTHPGGDAAADVADLVEGCVLADLRHGDLGQHGEIRKGRRAHIVMDLVPAEGEAAG